ncbi:hypothetical protein HK405_006288, partial [Cladochytrium tenue]
ILTARACYVRRTHGQDADLYDGPTFGQSDNGAHVAHCVAFVPLRDRSFADLPAVVFSRLPPTPSRPFRRPVIRKVYLRAGEAAFEPLPDPQSRALNRILAACSPTEVELAGFDAGSLVLAGPSPRLRSLSISVASFSRPVGIAHGSAENLLGPLVPGVLPALRDLNITTFHNCSAATLEALAALSLRHLGVAFVNSEILDAILSMPTLRSLRLTDTRYFIAAVSVLQKEKPAAAPIEAALARLDQFSITDYMDASFWNVINKPLSWRVIEANEVDLADLADAMERGLLPCLEAVSTHVKWSGDAGLDTLKLVAALLERTSCLREITTYDLSADSDTLADRARGLRAALERVTETRSDANLAIAAAAVVVILESRNARWELVVAGRGENRQSTATWDEARERLVPCEPDRGPVDDPTGATAISAAATGTRVSGLLTFANHRLPVSPVQLRSAAPAVYTPVVLSGPTSGYVPRQPPWLPTAPAL